MSKYDMTGIGLNLREIPDDNGSLRLMVLGLILDGPAHSAGVRQVSAARYFNSQFLLFVRNLALTTIFTFWSCSIFCYLLVQSYLLADSQITSCISSCVGQYLTMYIPNLRCLNDKMMLTHVCAYILWSKKISNANFVLKMKKWL
jgi:hypothetical protein